GAIEPEALASCCCYARPGASAAEDRAQRDRAQRGAELPATALWPAARNAILRLTGVLSVRRLLWRLRVLSAALRLLPVVLIGGNYGFAGWVAAFLAASVWNSVSIVCFC